MEIFIRTYPQIFNVSGGPFHGTMGMGIHLVDGNEHTLAVSCNAQFCDMARDFFTFLNLTKKLGIDISYWISELQDRGYILSNIIGKEESEEYKLFWNILVPIMKKYWGKNQLEAK